MNTKTILTFLKSKTFLIVIAVFCGLVVLVGTFSVGVMVGYGRARFSYAWGDNYQRNFAGPRGGFMHDMSGRDFIDAHGTAGQVVKVEQPTLVVKGRDGVEKTIVTTDDTSIVSVRRQITVSDIRVGDVIVVIGEPSSDGQIQAKLIRVMPMLTPTPNR